MEECSRRLASTEGDEDATALLGLAQIGSQIHRSDRL